MGGVTGMVRDWLATWLRCEWRPGYWLVHCPKNDEYLPSVVVVSVSCSIRLCSYYWSWVVFYSFVHSWHCQSSSSLDSSRPCRSCSTTSSSQSSSTSASYCVVSCLLFCSWECHLAMRVVWSTWPVWSPSTSPDVWSLVHASSPPVVLVG